MRYDITIPALENGGLAIGPKAPKPEPSLP
jgi:hypothetical protein